MIVYTANFERPEEYDVLCNVDPSVCRHVAFMDISEPMKLNGWECYPAVFKDANPRKRARHHKSLAHVLFPDEKETLWIDSNVDINGSPDFLSAFESDIVSLPHHASGPKNTWHEEAQRCMENSRVNIHAPKKDIQKQVDKYIAAGLSKSEVAPETRILYRKHNERTERFNMLWWGEVDKETIRDQVSFAYARKLGGASLELLNHPLSAVSTSECFAYRKHRPKVYYFSPFDLRGLGWAYNSCCSIVPSPECWICFMDMDVMLFPASIGMMIEDVLMNDAGCYDYFTCLATRIACKYMCVGDDALKERDLVKLYNISMDRLKGGIKPKPWNEESFAGYFMMFKKKLWEEIPFPLLGTANIGGNNDQRVCKVLGIDTEWARRLKAAGKRIGNLDGLTAVHYYRMGENNSEHREMLENPAANKLTEYAEPEIQMISEPIQEKSKRQHKRPRRGRQI